MGFSVIHIKKPLRRRAVLLLVSVPVIIVTWLNEVANVTWGCLRDFPKAFMAAWRGY
jgi:exosortase/archaeosortase